MRGADARYHVNCVVTLLVYSCDLIIKCQQISTMKTVVYFAIVLLLPVTSSQPTYDGTDGSCQMQDNTMLTFLRNEFHSIKSEISHVKRILAQLQRNKDNVKSPSCE